MRKFIFIVPLLVCSLTSCLNTDDDDTDYSEWKKRNDEYVANMEALTDDNGAKVYTKIVPEWATNSSVLIKWHNNREETANNQYALSNSTIDIKYEMEDIDGTSLGDSYSNTTWGDSIYRSKPNQNIVGMWAAMLEMHVGDSVTMIIPYNSGYGARQNGSILPYSTLIYHVKYKAVEKFERP